MTTTGSGVGGNIGGPQVPLQRELETTAWTEVNKAYLGIVKDAIELSFTQINPRYSTGFFGAYRSSEDQPLLDHPLESVRVPINPSSTTDESWRGTYEEFVKQLPPNIQERLAAESQLSLDNRSGAFVALNNVLITLSKLANAIKELSQPYAPESIQTNRATLNQALPFWALKNVADQGNEIWKSALASVLSIGPNDYYFDALHNYLGQTNEAIQSIHQMISLIQESGPSPENIAAMGLLAQTVEDLRSSWSSSGAQEELRILSPLLNAMEIISSSWTVGSASSSAFFLSLALGTSGTNEEGVFGPSFSQVMSRLSSAISSTILPQANIGQKKLLEMSLSVGVAVIAGLSALAVHSGFGSFPKGDDPRQIQSNRFFAFETALLLAESSSAFTSLSSSMIEACGGNIEAQARGGTILGQVGVLFSILAATGAGRQNPAYLMETVKNYLNLAASTALNLSDESLNSTGTLYGQIALQQSHIAFDAQDYEGVISAWSSYLENIGTAENSLKTDIKTITDAAFIIASMSNTALNEEPMTGITNVV